VNISIISNAKYPIIKINITFGFYLTGLLLAITALSSEGKITKYYPHFSYLIKRHTDSQP